MWGVVRLRRRREKSRFRGGGAGEAISNLSSNLSSDLCGRAGAHRVWAIRQVGEAKQHFSGPLFKTAQVAPGPQVPYRGV